MGDITFNKLEINMNIIDQIAEGIDNFDDIKEIMVDPETFHQIIGRLGFSPAEAMLFGIPLVVKEGLPFPYDIIYKEV